MRLHRFISLCRRRSFFQRCKTVRIFRYGFGCSRFVVIACAFIPVVRISVCIRFIRNRCVFFWKLFLNARTIWTIWKFCHAKIVTVKNSFFVRIIFRSVYILKRSVVLSVRYFYRSTSAGFFAVCWNAAYFICKHSGRKNFYNNEHYANNSRKTDFQCRKTVSSLLRKRIHTVFYNHPADFFNSDSRKKRNDRSQKLHRFSGSPPWSKTGNRRIK